MVIRKIFEKLMNDSTNASEINKAASNVRYARFIGEDGSLGLMHGKIYPVRMYVGKYLDRQVVGLRIYLEEMMVQNCPYSTLDKFFENWEVM